MRRAGRVRCGGRGLTLSGSVAFSNRTLSEARLMAAAALCVGVGGCGCRVCRELGRRGLARAGGEARKDSGLVVCRETAPPQHDHRDHRSCCEGIRGRLWLWGVCIMRCGGLRERRRELDEPFRRLRRCIWHWCASRAALLLQLSPPSPSSYSSR